MTATTAATSTTGRSTTRRTLQRLLAGLLIATTVVFGTTLWTFHRLHNTASAVHTHTAPAILDIALARAALVAADRAAIMSFQTGEAQLAGPGAEHQNQIAIASQSLTQVAEHNAAGEEGSRTLQLLNGLLVAYTSLIGQADAHYRQSAGSTLGAADLWHASRLLHAPRSGILAQLDRLLDAQKAALEDQISRTAVTPGTVLLWGVPIVVLLALLGGSQLFLKRRFRRTLNPWLMGATAALVLLGAVVSLVFVSQHRLDTSRDSLYQVVDDWRTQTDVTDAEGQRSLVDLVRSVCGEADSCGETVERAAEDLPQLAAVSDVDDDGELSASAQRVNEQVATAGGTARFESAIYVLAAAIGATSLLGFRRRIDEYRYRPR